MFHLNWSITGPETAADPSQAPGVAPVPNASAAPQDPAQVAPVQENTPEPTDMGAAPPPPGQENSVDPRKPGSDTDKNLDSKTAEEGK